jgi:hypothetical protein
MAKSFNGYKPVISTTIASMVFAAVLSGAATPYGEMYTAKSPEEVCSYLGEALKQADDARTTIFVDIDDTLIKEGSDVNSFLQFGNFDRMKLCNEELIKKLVALNNPNNSNLECFGLTSATALEEKDRQLQDRQVYGGHSFPKIRSDAINHLGILTNKYPCDGTFSLPLVTAPDSQSAPQELIPKLQPLTLSPEMEERNFFLGCEFFDHTDRMRFGPMRQNFYVKDPNGIRGPQEGYVQLIACPTYENGVIFSNFLEFNQGFQKGLIVRSFLLSRDRSEWPTVIIAIDDNLSMLESIQAVCADLGITFFGIHFNLPIFWLFAPPH